MPAPPRPAARSRASWTLLFHRGAILFFMAAGMGDTVIAPLYDVLLRARGVKFRFFHWVTGLSEDGTRITGVELLRQADVPADFDPLVKAGELLCWASRPSELPGLGLPDLDFEHLEDPMGRGERVTLPVGPDDAVLVALPPDSLCPVVAGLGHPELATRLRSAHTVATVGASCG